MLVGLLLLGDVVLESLDLKVVGLVFGAVAAALILESLDIVLVSYLQFNKPLLILLDLNHVSSLQLTFLRLQLRNLS